MVASPDSADPADLSAVATTVPPVGRWVLALVGAAVVSLLLGFAVGLARPRTTSLPARRSAAPA